MPDFRGIEYVGNGLPRSDANAEKPAEKADEKPADEQGRS
jgi:hypothetical protein